MHTVRAEEFTRIYDPSVGEAERWYINDHTIVRALDGTWHLIGITHAEPANWFDELHLAHATAPSLHGPWRKQPFALSTDPAWHETHLWAPHVIEHQGRYWMFVCGGGPSPEQYRIHLATSDDGDTWARHPDNPMVVDGYEARDPMVLRVDDRWVMYYTANSESAGGNHIVGAAFSDDLVHWSGRTIVYTDPLAGTGGGPTESPFVVRHRDRYLLFIGPDWEGFLSRERGNDTDTSWYRRTRVLASDDPLSFSLDGQVGLLEAHAAEVVVDEGGATWVTHCGWGQGGVSLAPLDLDAF